MELLQETLMELQEESLKDLLDNFPKELLNKFPSTVKNASEEFTSTIQRTQHLEGLFHERREATLQRLCSQEIRRSVQDRFGECPEVGGKQPLLE